MKTKTYNELLARIETLEKILNGGPNSGFHGHAGRKGKRGGSMPKGTLSIAAQNRISKEAQKSIKEAAKHEGQVTNDLSAVLTSNNATFEGLDFRLKGNASLERKIQSDAETLKCSYSAKVIQKAAARIHDNLRYTAIISDMEFGTKYNKIKEGLESKGYEFVKVKNTMGDTSGNYRGVNTQVKNPKGYIFELQFHTRQSFDTKMAQHTFYEVARDKHHYTATQRQAATEIMQKAYKNIRMPEGVSKIKSFNKIKEDE